MFLIELQAVVHGVHHLLRCQFLCQIGVGHVFGGAIALEVGSNDDGVADEVLGRIHFQRVLVLQQEGKKRTLLQVQFR